MSLFFWLALSCINLAVILLLKNGVIRIGSYEHQRFAYRAAGLLYVGVFVGLASEFYAFIENKPMSVDTTAMLLTLALFCFIADVRMSKICRRCRKVVMGEWGITKPKHCRHCNIDI